jgi:hypothetical protein
MQNLREFEVEAPNPRYFEAGDFLLIYVKIVSRRYLKQDFLLIYKIR